MLVCEWMIVSESDRKIYVSFVFFVFFLSKVEFPLPDNQMKKNSDQFKMKSIRGFSNFRHNWILQISLPIDFQKLENIFCSDSLSPPDTTKYFKKCSIIAHLHNDKTLKLLRRECDINKRHLHIYTSSAFNGLKKYRITHTALMFVIWKINGTRRVFFVSTFLFIHFSSNKLSS